jgi:hypothetical protein
MKLYTALVQSVFDPIDPTMLQCRILKSNMGTDDSVSVLYTSPFNRSNFIGAGGLTAYPTRGDVVLIAQADNDKSYFYMSTVTAVGNQDKEGGIENFPADKSLNELDELKRSVSLKDNLGGALDMVDKSSETTRKSYVKLSDGPDAITLNRQAQNESIHLRTRGGDTQIRMNGPRKFSGIDHGPGSMLVQGERNTVLKSKKGNVRVEAAAEARSIMIKNNAQFIGMNVSNATDPFSGQITVESLYNQICLRTYGYGPFASPFNGIFLQSGITPVVAVTDPSVSPTGGAVQAHGGHIAQMIAGGPLYAGVRCTGELAPESPGSAAVDIQAPVINLTATAAININAPLVNFQNGVTGLPIIPRPTNLDAQPPVPGAP